MCYNNKANMSGLIKISGINTRLCDIIFAPCTQK